MKQTLTVNTPTSSSPIQVLDGATQVENNGAVRSIGVNTINTQTTGHIFTIKNVSTGSLTVTSITADPGFAASQVSGVIASNGTATFNVTGIPTDPSAPTYATVVITLSDGSTFAVNVSASVGVPTGIAVTLSASAIELYPNPTTGITNLEFNGAFDNVAVTIYSADGSKVATSELASVNQTNRQLDIQELPSGVYFVEINCAQGKLIKRLIKQQ